IPIFTIDGFVKLLEETYRLQILLPAMFVGYPFAFFTGIIEVEHRGHGIDPQAIHMEAVQPKQSIADQKGAYLVSSIVEDITLPIGMVALAGIGVFVQKGAVEIMQTMHI